jgi:hypothetical protein
MTKILAGIAALTMLGAASLPLQASAAEQKPGISKDQVTDLSSQRRHWRHRHHHVYRHWGPRYRYGYRHWGPRYRYGYRAWGPRYRYGYVAPRYRYWGPRYTAWGPRYGYPYPYRYGYGYSYGPTVALGFGPFRFGIF